MKSPASAGPGTQRARELSFSRLPASKFNEDIESQKLLTDKLTPDLEDLSVAPLPCTNLVAND
jgi:hypothetical protein